MLTLLASYLLLRLVRPLRSAPARGMVAAVALCALAAGCGYIIGNPFPMNVRTVHVPTFTSESFRRGFELQLTEAVQKQIQMRTPFAIVPADQADTRLVGHIRGVDKRPVNQNRFDDPRELELSLAVEVRWENLRTGELIGQQTMPLTPEVAHLISEASFAPEAGQSLATGTQQAVDDLARQIVGMMEATW
jgi:hypothetical protein